MKKQRKWLLLVAISTVCMIFYTITMLPQDRVYAEYKNAFKEISHPLGTKFVANYNAFGALEKTRVMYKEDFPQGCDYRVGEVREYSGSKENLKSFYAAQTVNVRGQKLSLGILFIPIDQAGKIEPLGLTRDESMEWGPLGFDLLENLKGDQSFLKIKAPGSYYYVGISDFSLSDHDIRCQF